MGNFKYLDRYLEKLVNSKPAGCGCKVTQFGKTIYEGYFGFADIEKKKPITAENLYRQASTTKVAVNTGLMQLFERGKFLLDDPIGLYLPEWKETTVAEVRPNGQIRVRPAARPITVRDCMTMSMGLGYGGKDYTHAEAEKRIEALSKEKPDYTLQDFLSAVADVPMAFDPGTHFLYGRGHELVAGLIEAISGMPVGDYLKKNLFDPLGMKDTAYRYRPGDKDRMVTLYLLDEVGKRTPSSDFDALHEPDAKFEGGGAGLFSTVRDYSALMTMLANDGVYEGEHLLGRKTIDLIRRNQLNDVQLKDFFTPYNEGYGYGLGMRTMMNPSASNGSIGDFGWTGMFGTYAQADPAERLAIVYMHNCLPNYEQEIHLRVRHIVYGAID